MLFIPLKHFWKSQLELQSNASPHDPNTIDCVNQSLALAIEYIAPNDT